MIARIIPFLPGIGLAAFIGAASYTVRSLSKSYFLDPLLMSLLVGIVLRFFMEGHSKILMKGIQVAPQILIPIGIVFYAFKNINFVKYSQTNLGYVFILLLAMISYFGITLFLGKILNQKKEITYLTATGSGVCGASAIAVTSNAMDAESDDVSISLLAVAFVGLVALFIICPMVAAVFGLSNKAYALLTGGLLQFTGYVKAAMVGMPPLTAAISNGAAIKLASALKATRYLGLLVTIPLFGRTNKRYSFLILALFLLSGAAGSFLFWKDQDFYGEAIIPVIKPVYSLLWSMAMGAIGLNADPRQLLSDNGLKALMMAFGAFIGSLVLLLTVINFVTS